MGLPQRTFFAVQEVAIRWDCSLDDLAGWAINGKPEVVMAIEPIQQNGTILSGLVVVPVVDILSMFRRWASGPQRRVIRRVRPIGQKDWVMIADPENHITVEPSDLLILASEVCEFEIAHGLAKRAADPGGAPSRYDWEGLYISQMVRLHEDGLPATQGEWVAEVQDWFATTSPGREIPDESTIRRRLTPIWRALRETP